MKPKISQYRILILLVAGILIVFLARTLLAARYETPRLFDLFDSLTVAGSLILLLRGFRSLRRGDWIAAVGLAALVGVGMLFATLFTPYPFFGVVGSNAGQAMVRGLFTFLAALGGLVIMRQGGPVDFHAARSEWKKAGRGILLGLGIGFPLAILNVFALQFTQNQAISWQNPLAALLDAFQPGIVEEVIYRFALWGLFWLALRSSLRGQSPSLAGLLAMLVHTFAHYDALFVQAPLVALGMGLVLSVVWGLPPFFLARRRGLESAIAFHWIQDFTRFVAGF